MTTDPNAHTLAAPCGYCGTLDEHTADCEEHHFNAYAPMAHVATIGPDTIEPRKALAWLDANQGSDDDAARLWRIWNTNGSLTSPQWIEAHTLATAAAEKAELGARLRESHDDAGRRFLDQVAEPVGLTDADDITEEPATHELTEEEGDATLADDGRADNPWADRWEHQVGGYEADPVERALITREANEARLYPTRTCTECGQTAHLRPGVGGWWCPNRHIVR